MLAGGIPKTPLLPANCASSASNKDVFCGAYVSTLPAGMKGFQRAQHDYSSVSATNATALNTPNYSHTTHAPTTINHTSYNNTTPSANPIAANSDFAANPYLAGHSQGRGKHLTQPSWMNDSNIIVPCTTLLSAPPSADSIHRSTEGTILSGFVRPTNVSSVENGTYKGISTATTASGTRSTSVTSGTCGIAISEGVTSVPEVEVPRPVKRS